MDHDGGTPDDYMATALLLTMPHIDPVGFVVTPADCYIEPATRATRKILALFGREHVPVAASEAKGHNPFPAAWRQNSYAFDDLIGGADMMEPASAAVPSGVGLMEQLLGQAEAPLTLLVTGPLSNVAALVDRRPDLAGRIEEMVWMGGSLDVPGNVSPEMEPSHDGSAE